MLETFSDPIEEFHAQWVGGEIDGVVRSLVDPEVDPEKVAGVMAQNTHVTRIGRHADKIWSAFEGSPGGQMAALVYPDSYASIANSLVNVWAHPIIDLVMLDQRGWGKSISELYGDDWYELATSAESFGYGSDKLEVALALLWSENDETFIGRKLGPVPHSAIDVVYPDLDLEDFEQKLSG